MGTSIIAAVLAFVLMLPGMPDAPTDMPGLPPEQDPHQASTPFNVGEAHKAIEKLATLLEENFIYPEIGRSYARMLRSRVASGAYSKFETAGEFAKVVTADLQAVHPEGHLRLQPPIAAPASGRSAAKGGHENGVGRYGWLAPGAGYLELHGFTGDIEEYNRLLAELRTAMEELSTAKTLIIDARPHRGGALEEMDIMFSYLFDKPATLVMLDTRLEVERRGGSPFTEGERLKRVQGPEGIVRLAHLAVPGDKRSALGKAEVYLLTSKMTASAGEHLTLALKRTRRATVIGETTRGAGHFGQTTPLGGGYRAFIPVGRTFDPDTDKGWEQTGIEPDIRIEPEKALDEALKRARIDQAAAKKALESMKGD